MQKSQYEVNLDKNIEFGDLVRYHVGLKSDDGICKVMDREDLNGNLRVKVVRLMKPNGQIVKRSHRLYWVGVTHCTKVTAESMYDEAVKYAEAVKKHLTEWV